ncbi:MAG: Amuc_1100 family pilus-like protein [Opitutales bacterium]|jgi:hypothetical protein
MPVFLKQNISFFSFVGTALIACLTMWIYSCGLEKDFAETSQKVVSARATMEGALQRQAEFNDVDENLRVAHEDSEILAQARKRQMTNLQVILKNEKLLGDANRKSSQEVNGDLQSFIQRYREILPAKGIIIKGGAIEPTDGFPDSGRDRESFGFSKYDGSWPSFEPAEAREIFKQKQIIKGLLDKLISAHGAARGQPLELKGFKREIVGKEDSKKKDPRETLDLATLGHALVKRADRIETYAFSVEFSGRTGILRKLIAQLTPPFIVSDLKVHRATGGMEGSLPPESRLPFIPGDPKEKPIIEDVNSRFILIVEYLLAVHAEPAQFVKQHYLKKDEDGETQALPEGISSFLADDVFEMEQNEFDALVETLLSEDSE